MARYPGAVWLGDNVPNVGGPIGQVRLGVMHIMSGTLAGTDNWFQNPAAQVSAHFGVGKDGTVHQYVDTSMTAWAEANYNGVAISIEHEGNSGDSLTTAQIAADVALYEWLNTTSNIPLVRTTDPNGSGWIGHGELGVAGGNHLACPGQPILNQIPTILAQTNQPPAPTPTTSGDEEMASAVYQENGMTHVMWVDNTGTFHHKYQGVDGPLSATQAWGEDSFQPTGLLANATPVVEVTSKYTHVYVRGASNGLKHFYQAIGQTNWNSEQL